MHLFDFDYEIKIEVKLKASDIKDSDIKASSPENIH